MSDPPDCPPDDAAPAKPLPLQLELPASFGLAPPSGSSAATDAAAAGRRGARFLVAAAGLAAVTIPAWLAMRWALPWYVRRACVEAAAEHGIALSVEDVAMDRHGFRLGGVRAAIDAVPGAHVDAAEVEVDTRGLRPDVVTIRGAAIELRGSWAKVEQSLAAWRERELDARETGAADEGARSWAPARLRIDGARLAWEAPAGQSARLEASGVGAQLTWQDAGPEIHARSDEVRLSMPAGTFGPWRVDLDRAPGASRTRVALDPAVPEACTILVVGDGDRTTSVDAVVPRSLLSHLGVPPALFGGRGADPEIEISAHYLALGPSLAELRATGGVYGLALPGVPGRLDLTWNVNASGDAIAGIDLGRSRLRLGAFAGALEGTFRRYGDGFRAEVAWAPPPASCAAFAPRPAAAPWLHALPEAAAAAAARTPAPPAAAIRVRGTFDSRTLGAAQVDLQSEGRCPHLP